MERKVLISMGLIQFEMAPGLGISRPANCLNGFLENLVDVRRQTATWTFSCPVKSYAYLLLPPRVSKRDAAGAGPVTTGKFRAQEASNVPMSIGRPGTDTAEPTRPPALHDGSRTLASYRSIWV